VSLASLAASSGVAVDSRQTVFWAARVTIGAQEEMNKFKTALMKMMA